MAEKTKKRPESYKTISKSYKTISKSDKKDLNRTQIEKSEGH